MDPGKRVVLGADAAAEAPPVAADISLLEA